jgi:hypothetical protein
MNRRRELHVDKVVFDIAFGVILAILFLYALSCTDFFDRQYLDNLRDFSDNWKSSEGNWYDLDKISLGDFEGHVVLSKPLPNSTTDADSLCFESINVNLRVFLEDNEIYSYFGEENITGMGYGSMFHEIGIPASAAGKMLTMDYECCSSGLMKGSITGMYLGAASNYVHLNVIKRAAQFIITLSIMFFGILILLIWLVFPDKAEAPFNIGALGCGAFLLGMWLMSGSGLLQLLAQKVIFWRVLNHFSIILAIYPFVIFFNSMTRNRRKSYEVAAFMLTVFLELLIVLLRYVSGVDMMQTFPIFEAGTALLIFVMVLVILLDNYYYCKARSENIEYIGIYVGLLIMIISAVIEFSIYLMDIRILYLFGTVMRIGMLLFINIVMYNFSVWWAKSQAIADRDRFINSTLQFAVTSKNPEESIRLMLEYIGRELKARRAYIYEDVGKGKLQNTYEWFKEGLDPMAKELSVLYATRDAVSMENMPKNSYECMLVYDPEDIKNVSPGLYYRMKKYSLQTVAIGPLRMEDEVIGFWTVDDIPADRMEEFGEAMGTISYFLVQSINQRKERDRILYYSYHDPISGAQNRSALRKFTSETLNLSQPFGYLLCEIKGLREVNNILGQDDGDRLIKRTAECLIETFGDSGVFRLSGNEFAAFGFESDETFFDNDVEITKMHLKEIECDTEVASVFCANGTTDLNIVTNYVYELLKKKGNEN